ncbi:MAG: DUF2997 domain-containing protein [Kiritimatiellaeota bacterium]|nr:DUF2997 domain-containing protein [Kiritimatiellota bacterium]
MEQQEFEIEIRKDGEVKVHMKGIKGQKCMRYAELFEKIVGPIVESEFTAEYYEPEIHTDIDITT